MLNRKQIECDFCVVGGGMSGLCAAISAAREGLSVTLMHERPMLGGNASSEIRMWICGSRGRNNRATGILEEIELENMYRNPTKSFAVWDTVLYDFAKREKNLTLLLNCTCMDAKTENGNYEHGRDTKIISVTGYQMTTQTFYDVKAKFFADCSGDSILAPLTSAKFKIGREGKNEYGEETSTQDGDSMTMGMSCLCLGRETHRNVKFIAPEWAAKLTDKDFENRMPNLYDDTENFWYLELGGNRNTIDDTEILRDELLSLALGTWDYVKNSGSHDADKWDLSFVGFLPGKRESRRMCGEYTVTQRDISDGKVFDDEIAFGGWPLDDHFPGGFYHRGVPNTDVPTPAPYSLPYRALYSKNVDNLFFAGRNISMTHMAMSSIRVMATCSLLGEAVGKAASIAVKNDVRPHDVYLQYIENLQAMLLAEDSFLPHKLRFVSDKCKNATLNVNANALRNGQDRAHKIYSTDDDSCCYKAEKGEKIEYRFDKTQIKSIHIVFDSDINRDTLTGSQCERTHSTRANEKLDSPMIYMPKTLCKEFVLTGSVNGVEKEILHVSTNRKRAHHINLNQELDALTLTVLDSWGDKNEIPVISFDFA